jgi:hypothetical protein
MIRPRCDATLTLAFAFVVASPASAWAQAGPPPANPAPAAGTIAPTTTTTTTTSGYPGAAAAGISFGNPQAANGTIGGGNATESSSHPVTGDEEDTFDYGRGGAGGGAAHGDANGPIFVMGGGGHAPPLTGEVPSTLVVKRGDTLWGICDTYFQNPYQWPRLWSYNPQIKNPHWIYPGDELRMKEGDATGLAEAAKNPLAASGDPNKMSIIDRRRQVPSGTVFLRDEGWVQDASDEIWGEVSGSSGDKMFLADNDELYLAIKPGHDVRLGQELTIFHHRMTAASGEIVQILGTARVDDYNAHDRVARAKIIETLDVIERGANIGPLERRFEIVPPRRNEVDVQARVLASVHPHAFYGQNNVVFIDKGEAAGLKRGNRLFILRRGDAWRQSLVTRGAGYRVSPDDERPMPPMEKTPGSKRQEDTYPDEVVGELRVLSVKKDSAVCLVSQSRLEIEVSDVAVARKGY